MWSAAPSLVRDIDATRALLDMTAEDTEDLTCGGDPDNNNVWGQGKLDAFLAVEDSPRGPTGTIGGTVTDAGTDDAIAGATVTMSGEVDRSRTTDADGGYTISLPVGDYHMTATAFGYVMDSADATVDEDQTTTVDFALDAIDRATVTGTVTDGSGHGWPLYAKVDVADTPVSTYTDPVTGTFSVTLPVGSSYDIVVSSEYPGYASGTATVELDGDTEVDVALDGLIYIMGGWDGTGATTATVLIYDPASDSYSTGANMPAGRTASGAAALDGKIYVVGGCTTNACPTSNTVWEYDPAADEWTTLPNYPQSTGWLACGGLEGSLVCAGGTDGSTASTATYALTPGASDWEQRASMPYDNWAMGSAVANGTLMVSAGVTDGFSTVTNRSATYDALTDEWTEIEPANVARYRMGAACGFYKLGGSVAGFTPSTDAEVHPEYGDCAVDVDIPWLEVSPPTATLQPGGSFTVTVSMDSGVDEVDQPGTYTAGVGIRHDTPYQVSPVGVTMNVTPNNWGKISGTVTGMTCAGDEVPLPGAIVQINGRNDTSRCGPTAMVDTSGGSRATTVRFSWWWPRRGTCRRPATRRSRPGRR